MERVNIVELIDRRVSLKKMGSNFVTCCPFHNEKTPSFTVSEPKQFYYCFGCGAHGNAIGFLMAYNKLEFVESVEELANFLGLPMPQAALQPTQVSQAPLYKVLDQAARYYQSQLMRASQAQSYLHSRGLSPEIMQKFAIGFALAGWDNLRRQLNSLSQSQLLESGLFLKSKQGKIYDRFRNRIMIPIKDSRGRVIAFGGRSLGEELPKYLNSPETELFHKGNELYGLYEARQNNAHLDQVLVVEGYMDVIALWQFGISNVVGTLGTATSQRHLQKLFRYTPEVIFCFDGDRAGQEAAWRALEVSLEVIQDGWQVRFMFLPKAEDPDSLIRKEGEKLFRERMSQAISLADFFFKRLCSLANPQFMDGKAKLAKLGLGLIQKIRNGVFKQLMLEKLASVVGVHAADLSHYVVKAAKTQNPAKTKLPKKILSPMQLAIALILQYPQLVLESEPPGELAQVNLPGIDILLKLLELLRINPNLITAQLLEYWRDSKSYKYLVQLSFIELLVPTSGIQAELSAIFKKLVILTREQKIQELIAKAKSQLLTAEEKGFLLELIKEHHNG